MQNLELERFKVGSDYIAFIISKINNMAYTVIENTPYNEKANLKNNRPKTTFQRKQKGLKNYCLK